jgi:hypothetical protein
MTILLIALIISLGTVLLLLQQAPVIPAEKTDISAPLTNSYSDAITTDLAILISNRDLPREEIEKVLQSHGYESYEDGCEKIASTGKLAYVPQFEVNGVTYGGYYTTKSTILYHTALEAGIIRE